MLLIFTGNGTVGLYTILKRLAALLATSVVTVKGITVVPVKLITVSVLVKLSCKYAANPGAEKFVCSKFPLVIDFS